MTHRYPCLDIYKNKEFETNDEILHQIQKSHSLKDSKLKISQFTKLKAAFRIDSIWKVDKLHIHFLDGKPHQKEWVIKIVKKHIEPICNNLKFIWNSSTEESEIRISFKQYGQAWSAIGSDALKFGKTEPTMNLGWLDDDKQYDLVEYKNTGQVVLHEFCHALGMIHEHQNPKNNPIKWNKPVIFKELKNLQGWTRDEVEQNMFKKYGDVELCKQIKNSETNIDKTLQVENYCEGKLVNGSSYDKYSIMHYFYPKTWIIEGPDIPKNSVLSNLDKLWLKKFYGERNQVNNQLVNNQVNKQVNKQLNNQHNSLKRLSHIFIFFIIICVFFLYILQVLHTPSIEI